MIGTMIVLPTLRRGCWQRPAGGTELTSAVLVCISRQLTSAAPSVGTFHALRRSAWRRIEAFFRLMRTSAAVVRTKNVLQSSRSLEACASAGVTMKSCPISRAGGSIGEAGASQPRRALGREVCVGFRLLPTGLVRSGNRDRPGPLELLREPPLSVVRQLARARRGGHSAYHQPHW